MTDSTDEPREAPDPTYAFAVGLYAGVVLGPGVVVAASPWLTGSGALYVALLAAVVSVAAVAGVAASRTAGLGVRLGRRKAAWLLAVAPLAWVAGVGGAAAAGVDVSSVSALALLAVPGGMLLGLVVVAMSRTRYANRAVRDAAELATWDARWPKRWRHAAIAAGVAVGVVGVAGIVAERAFGVAGADDTYLLVLFVAPMVAPTTAPRTFHATDAGLVVERPHQRRFRPWSAFSEYEVTADALVVRTTPWWRVDVRCDRSDVEDVDAVAAALDDALGGEHR